MAGVEVFPGGPGGPEGSVGPGFLSEMRRHPVA